MKKPIIVGILLMLLIGSFVVVAVEPVDADAVMNIREFRITTNTSGQYNPDIDGSHVVWQDDRNGNWDIYMYTLMGAFEPETRITTSTANQLEPSIYGNRIVYMDDRNGNYDIYMYDLVTQTETRITNSTANQFYPAIYGDRIVWQDNRNGNWDIYLYDLVTQAETRITWGSTNENPAIYGGRIVYQKSVKDNLGYTYQNVYSFDLSTGVEMFISDNPLYHDPHPAIYADRIVWVGSTWFVGVVPTYEYLISMYDVGTHAHWRATDTSEMQDNYLIDIQDLQDYPDTYGNYIVWQDRRNGNQEVYVYNLDRGTETRVTNNTANQQNAAVYGGRIVYQDDRNGNWDIYMAELSYSVPDAPPMPGTAPETQEPSTGFVDFNATFVDLPALKFVDFPAPETDKTAALIAALQRDGFTVQEGKLEKFDIMAMYDAGIIPGCFGNNPSTPYLVEKLPPYPGLIYGGRITDAPINPSNKGLWLDYFMEPDEAIVYIGPTPPEVKYFSYRSYISSRWFPEQNTSEQIFASLGDQLNNFRINTGTSSTPYNSQVMIITTADRGTNERVRKAALMTGYPTNMMNDDIIPSGLIRMGKENTSDAITVIHRVAFFANETLGREYVNSTPGTVLRLTPNTSNVLQPYSVPPLIVRGTGDTRELDLLQDQEALREAIIARMGDGMVVTGNKTSIFILEGYDSLQRESSAQGDNRDTVYLANGNYTLSGDEFIIIYGVNHQKTGKATYTNSAVYGTEALNGVAAVTDSDYAGSADPYLPGNKDSGLLYVWKFARHCNGEAGCTEVPSCCGGSGIPEDVPVMVGFRAYVEPETGIGPSWTEILYDQVLHFAPA